MDARSDADGWRELGMVLRRPKVSDRQLLAEVLQAHGLADVPPNDLRWGVVCLRDDALTSYLRVEVRTARTPPRVRAKPRHDQRPEGQ